MYLQTALELGSGFGTALFFFERQTKKKPSKILKAF